MSNLRRAKQATGFDSVCLLLKPGSHVSMLVTSCFLRDHKASPCSGSSRCHQCSLRHHHLGHTAGEDQFCWSTSRKQLEEENGGSPYSRSSGGGREVVTAFEAGNAVMYASSCLGGVCFDVRMWGDQPSLWNKGRKVVVCLCVGNTGISQAWVRALLCRIPLTKHLRF